MDTRVWTKVLVLINQTEFYGTTNVLTLSSFSISPDLGLSEVITEANLSLY